MNKRSRWEECKNKFFSAINAGKTPDREHLKRWGANKIAAKTDVLEVRASYAAKHYALGGLLSVAVCAGKQASWASGRIMALCNKRPGLSLYPYNVRVIANGAPSRFAAFAISDLSYSSLKVKPVDLRYTVTAEWYGASKPGLVSRFCGDWIGVSDDRDEAWAKCADHWKENFYRVK